MSLVCTLETGCVLCKIRAEIEATFDHLQISTETVCIWRSGDRASWYSLIIKPTTCTKFSNLFWNITLRVSESSSVYHQEFFTVNTAHTLLATCQQTCMTYTIVQWKTHDGGQRNCPKYVEFYSKNEFEKLVHLVGFIIRRVCIVWGIPEQIFIDLKVTTENVRLWTSRAE